MYIVCYIGDIFYLLSCLINTIYEYHVDLYSGHVEQKIFGFHVLGHSENSSAYDWGALNTLSMKRNEEETSVSQQGGIITKIP
jgi:hypothetical protein